MLELNKETFEQEVLKAEGPVLVDFWSPSCVPCKELFPHIEALSEVYGGEIKFCKLDTSAARRLAIGQKVLGLPTITLYLNGEKHKELVKEEATKEAVEAMIKTYLGK